MWRLCPLSERTILSYEQKYHNLFFSQWCSLFLRQINADEKCFLTEHLTIENCKIFFSQLKSNHSFENIQHIHQSKSHSKIKKATAVYRQQFKNGPKKLKNMDVKMNRIISLPESSSCLKSVLFLLILYDGVITIMDTNSILHSWDCRYLLLFLQKIKVYLQSFHSQFLVASVV